MRAGWVEGGGRWGKDGKSGQGNARNEGGGGKVRGKVGELWKEREGPRIQGKARERRQEGRERMRSARQEDPGTAMHASNKHLLPPNPSPA